jgi:hypothetical protein
MAGRRDGIEIRNPPPPRLNTPSTIRAPCFEPTLGGLPIVADVHDLIGITQSCDRVLITVRHPHPLIPLCAQRPILAWSLVRISNVRSNPNRAKNSFVATAASSRGRAINSV